MTGVLQFGASTCRKLGVSTPWECEVGRDALAKAAQARWWGGLVSPPFLLAMAPICTTDCAGWAPSMVHLGSSMVCKAAVAGAGAGWSHLGEDEGKVTRCASEGLYWGR